MRIFEFFIAFGVVLVEVTSASPAGPLKDGRLARRAGGGLTPPPSPGDLRGYPTDIWNPPQNLRTIYLYKNFRPAPHDPRYPFGPSELDPKMKRPYDLYMEAVNVCMDNKWVEYVCLFGACLSSVQHRLDSTYPYLPIDTDQSFVNPSAVPLLTRTSVQHAQGPGPHAATNRESAPESGL